MMNYAIFDLDLDNISMKLWIVDLIVDIGQIKTLWANSMDGTGEHYAK